MSNHHGIIAIHEDDPNAAGAIVWWRLSGGIDLRPLCAAWEAAGLEPSRLPDTPTPVVALRRAVSSLAGAHRLIRSHPKGGVALVDESTDNDELTYTPDLRAYLDKVMRLEVEPADHVDAAQIRTDFARLQVELIQADVSPWLCDIMDRYVDAVRLRDTGGVYFVPRHMMARWKSIVAVLQATTKHTLNAVPALRTTEAVKAIEDAIAAEAEQAVREIEDELDNGGLGKRALENRVAITTGVEQKLERYEQFLGGRLDIIHAKLDAMRAQLTVAITQADIEAEKERLAQAS